MDKSQSELVFDEAFDVLADRNRRRLLVELLEHNPIDDAPVVVADNEDEGDSVTSLVQMEHVHLPKLEQYGFIEWDRDNNEVTKGPRFDEIRPLLELIDDHEDELPPGWL